MDTTVRDQIRTLALAMLRHPNRVSSQTMDELKPLLTSTHNEDVLAFVLDDDGFSYIPFTADVSLAPLELTEEQIHERIAYAKIGAFGIYETIMSASELTPSEMFDMKVPVREVIDQIAGIGAVLMDPALDISAAVKRHERDIALLIAGAE